MKRNIILLFVATWALFSSATVYFGKVVDENDVAVEFATVSLLNTSDSTLVTGATTDEHGEFSINASISAAIIKVTYIGYQPIVITTSGDAGTLKLTPESTMLGDVTVTASRPTYHLTTEGISTDVEGTLLGRVGTASKVLENLPGVQKKGDGIEVFGKGKPLIYVNGRILRDNSELEQIQSSDIKSVELITNPGAKYKADVECVIIIKTKRPQGEGFSFNTQASYYRSYNNDLDLGINWNYRHHGLDVFGSVWYNDDRYLHRSDLLLEVNTDKQWRMDEHSKYNTLHRSIYASLGANYVFNDNHAIGFRYDSKGWFRNETTGSFVADITANGEFYDHLDNAINSETKANMPHTLNAYYNGRVGKTGIDLNTDYVFSKERTCDFNDEMSQERESRTVTSRSTVRNQLWATKLVLSWTLWGGNLQAGAEYDLTNHKDDYINPEKIVPTTYTEHRERNYAFFTEYSHPLPFGQLRVGLRNENVTSNYYNAGVRIAEQSRTYHHLIPSVGLVARAGQVQIMANYGMKIQRPYYYMLSGAVTYANRFTWEKGNPMLKPMILNEASLMAMWRWINVTVRYKHTRDAILNVAEEAEGNTETTIITRANLHHSDAILSMVTLSPKFGVYQPSLSLGLIKDWCKIPTPSGFISPKKPVYLVQFNNNFRITPTLTASANLSFTSKGDQMNLSIVKPNWYTYVSLTKTFLDDRLSVQIAGHNLLNTQENIKMNYGTRTLLDRSLRDSRQFEVTVRYKFNATGSKWRGSGAGESEKARFGSGN